MKISFFVPKIFDIDISYSEIADAKKEVPLRQGSGMGTLETWIYQTWYLLKQSGISCDLVNNVPQEGILIVHNDINTSFLNYQDQLPQELFIVNVVADVAPHPAAHVHLLQNERHVQRLPEAIFIPIWPQPTLIPRDTRRGDCFENIHFFGRPENIASSLFSEEWNYQLRRETGLYLSCKPPSQWHDYSETDLALAVRDFSRSLQLHKPAAKLYNAWLAGVPFIGGRDSAYAQDGHAGRDYLVATSPQKIIEQLKKLKDNPSLRKELVAQGNHSRMAFTQEATLQRWKKLILETLPSMALQWQKKTPLQRRAFFMKQQIACWVDLHWR